MELKKALRLVSQRFNDFAKLGIKKDKAGTYLFVLVCIYLEEQDALSIFDDDGQSREALIVYKDLEFKGLLELGDLGYHLTIVSKNMLDDILVEEEVKEELPIDMSLVEKPKRQVKVASKIDWIDEYLDLWPSKSPAGYYLKGDKKNIHSKMEKFIDEYGFSKEEIFKATKAYLNERREEDYNYTKKVSNFIFYREIAMGHNISSDLAAWCEYMKDKQNKPEVTKEVYQGFDDFL